LTAENEAGAPSVPEEGLPENPRVDEKAPSPEAGAPADAPAPGPEAPGSGQPAPGSPAVQESQGAPGADPAAPSPEAPPAPPAPPRADGRPSLIVRHGAMGLLGRFRHSLDAWQCNQRAVIRSDRGQEVGTILCVWQGCSAPGGVPAEVRGEVLRLATPTDVLEERHLLDDQGRELTFCRGRAAERGLLMKVVAAEHLFGGDRIVFYFLAETRVDFRALVRDLAQEYRTRIEMRQIGVRDEARLLGDYERCGRPLCCRAWIKELEPVSMKMAKLQKATLDPAKISGRCGRLMCCLRFEDATYRELAKALPRRNTFVRTTEGVGKVVDVDVVTQMVGVVVEGGKRINVPVDALLERDLAPSAVAAAPAAATAAAPGRREGRPADRPPRPRAGPADARPQPRRDRPAGPPPAAAPGGQEAAPGGREAAPGGRGAAPGGQEAAPGGQGAGQAPGEGGGEGRSGRRRRRRRRPRHGRRPDGGAPPAGAPSGPQRVQTSDEAPDQGSRPPPPGPGPGDPPAGA